MWIFSIKLSVNTTKLKQNKFLSNLMSHVGVWLKLLQNKLLETLKTHVQALAK